MEKRFDIYEKVTDLICQKLEAGVVPWQMPFKTASSLPRNLVSKKVYRGFNFFYLLSFNFPRPWFLSWNQVQELGGHVRKGEKALLVVFWKMLDNASYNPTEPKGESRQIPFLRYYYVYNIDSVDGIDPARIPSNEAFDHEFDHIGACDELVERWTDSPRIENTHDKAAYAPLRDLVMMPSPRTFISDEMYYSVLFHEICHATGNASRTGRHARFPDHRFGSQDYSAEELVAEMGAAYLCALCGIENTATLNNSAAYIQSWMREFRNNPKMIMQASTMAQAAVDYILEHQEQTVPTGSDGEAVPEPELVYEF